MSEAAVRRFDAESLIRTLSRSAPLADRLALAIALGPPVAKRGQEPRPTPAAARKGSKGR